MKKIICLMLIPFGVFSQNQETTNETETIKNRIGITALPFMYKSHLYVTYEHKLTPKLFNQPLSLGCDVAYNFKGMPVSSFYDREVSFNTKFSVVNPWLGIYFKGEKGFLKDLLIPQMVMLKPSFVFLDPGADNQDIALFPAYEVMMGNIARHKWFFFKIEYGFKHFLTESPVNYNGETALFPSKRILPAVGLFTGINF